VPIEKSCSIETCMEVNSLPLHGGRDRQRKVRLQVTAWLLPRKEKLPIVYTMEIILVQADREWVRFACEYRSED